MLDRYLVAGGRALDLATGASIRWRLRRDCNRRAPVLFTVRGRSRLIDIDLRGSSRIEVWERDEGGAIATTGDSLQAFCAALADAKDGRPRAIDVLEPSPAAWALAQRMLAREARLAGFVPLAAGALGAVLSQARWRWPAWLKQRSIVVFATDAHLTADASLALFKLATKDARPHLIVRGVTSDLWRPRLVSAVMQVHESGPAAADMRGLDRIASGTRGCAHRRRQARSMRRPRLAGASCLPRPTINRRRAARWRDP